MYEHAFAPSPFSISTKRPPASSPSSVRTSTNIVHDLSAFKDDGFVVDDDAAAVEPKLEIRVSTARLFDGAFEVLWEPTVSELLPERRPLLVLCELDCDRLIAFDFEPLALMGGGVDGRTARVCCKN